MRFELKRFFLEFNEPFSIAHGSRTGTDVVLLKLVSDQHEAWGEASLPPYLPETQDSVSEFISDFFRDLKTDELSYSELHAQLMGYRQGNYAAKACVDIALCNLYSMKAGLQVWQWLGLQKEPLPLCTFTIGMGTPDQIRNKINAAKDFAMLKVKLGGGMDREIMEAVRSITDKPVCVDVNQGWHRKEDALEMIRWLSGMDVQFVEQPLPKGALQDMLWLSDKSPLPLYADESAQVADDVSDVSRCFHGVNVKLMKCGGVTEGLRMIRKAKALGMKVLIGSMSETSCGVTAAAQLSSLADYVDLDGPLLTRNNPFPIPLYEGGRIMLS